MRRSALSSIVVVAAVLTIPSGASAAPASSADAWQEISASRAAARSDAPRAVRPDRFVALELDRAALEDVLARAPAASTAPGGGLAISLPAPDGGFERFAIHRSAVMEPGLAARHPEISTYKGTGIDVPGSTVHLDLGSLGLHGSVRGPEGDWYIDPYFHRRQSVYVSYFGRDLTKNPHGEFVERPGAPAPDLLSDFEPQPQGGPATVPLRIYRLALVSDPAYANYFGPANVTSAKVALINRVNQPYGTDFGIELRLVADNDRLNFNTAAQLNGPNGRCGTAPCYTSAQTDFCSVSTLLRTSVVIGQIIGARGYDIGHIGMGVDGGGIAALGVVGGPLKALGCTGIAPPTGDLFAIDYVAHEMGHQFGGNHTFNGTESACSSGNRNGPTSVEPGSGSTIMAYAGICAQDDLQPHSDPYFSQRSLDEINGYVSSSQPPASEVQNVALRDFDTNGDSFTLTYRGDTSAPIVRGTNYNAASIEAAVESIIPRGTATVDGFAGSGSPDERGFQVSFGGALAGVPVARLAVTDRSGMSGFVGEIIDGGPVKNGGSTVIDSGNHRPVVSAPSFLRVPLRTPFRLTGGATDAESDPVTYLWEQNDVGGASGTTLADNTKVDGPLFRQFGTAAIVGPDDTLLSPSPGENAATPDPTRIFPDLAQIAAGHTNAAAGQCPPAPPSGPLTPAARDCYSEFLPTASWIGVAGDRTMHFRLTARDNNAIAGGVGSADTSVRIVPTAGPFRVTSQNTDRTIPGGKRIHVTWNPAGTAAPPISANRVSIRLSLDGGETFPLLLEGSTPNDGATAVTLPNTTAAHIRLKIEAVDNFFFDLSHGDVRLVAQSPR